MESWAIALIVIGSTAVTVYVLKWMVQLWARKKYRQLKLSSPLSHCDIDSFVNPDTTNNNNTTNKGEQPNPVNAVKCVLSHELQIGNIKKKLSGTVPIPLEFYESAHVPGLYVSRRQKRNDESPPAKKKKTSGGAVDTPASPAAVKTYTWDELLLVSPNKNSDPASSSSLPPIVVCTIRMGFGHHRLAYSVSSWAMSLSSAGRKTIFHDLLNIESPESDLIKSTDALYSKFSRIASEWGGPIERLWGTMMLQGDANALRIAANVAKHIQPLLLAYPKDTPIISTHQLCALVASAAGFTNVVNLVVDNWPQWFLTVPNTLNIVQGPVNYQCFLRLGVKPEELQWAGHWCPQDLVQNIEADCRKRLQRLEQGKPLRILIPVGGAGAQRTFIIQFVRVLAPYIQRQQIQLFLNAGDHEHMKTAFLQILDECNISFDTVQDTAGVRNFQQKLLSNDKNEPNHNVTLFAFDEYFPAVATTDLLCRVSDVLCCKPSELAFYCIPKLHIRRVGDHEAASAKRASELGDGTLEAREIGDALSYLDMFLHTPHDLLRSMNDAIIKNHSIGIYDGCRKAVEFSMTRCNNSTTTMPSEAAAAASS